MRFFFLLTGLLIGMNGPISAQKFHLSLYDRSNGLPSSRVRDIVEDQYGFRWIATDGGLARFDGHQFQTFSKEIPSQHGRYFYRDEQNIWYSHDAGISLIHPEADTAFLSLSIPGSIQSSDQALFYPNRMFKSAAGDLWISQPDGRIAVQSADTLLWLDTGDETPQNSESEYQFGETGSGTLWVASPFGTLFRFDPEKKILRPVAQLDKLHAMVIIGQTIWLGGQQLHRIDLDTGGERLKRIESWTLPEGEITAMDADSRARIYLGIRKKGLFSTRPKRSGPPVLKKVFSNNDPHRVDELPFAHINRIRVVSDREIWVAADTGMGFLQKRFFESVDDLPNGNTTAITEGAGEDLFINFGDVFQVRSTGNGFLANPQPGLQNRTISALASESKVLWAGSSQGELLKLTTDGVLLRRVDLRYRGEGIFYLFSDREKRLWICQAPAEKPLLGVAALLPDGQLKIYGKEQGLKNRILVLREGPRGRLYAAGIGSGSYLYRYLPEEDAFLNLSLPFDFTAGQNFEVHDLAIDPGGRIWLATTDGLLVHNLERIRKVDLGEAYREVEIRALATQGKDRLWLATDTHGLLLYHKGQILNLRAESGLPSKIMAYRSLLFDRAGRLWAGTAEGVVFSMDTMPIPPGSSQPVFLRAPGTSKGSTRDSLLFREKEEVSLRVVSPGFHGYPVLYQWRLDRNAWSTPQQSGSLSLGKMIVPGLHQLEVRARKKGGFSWSIPARFALHIQTPWHRLAAVRWGLVAAAMTVAFLFAWQFRRKEPGSLHDLRQTAKEYSESAKTPPQDERPVREQPGKADVFRREDAGLYLDLVERIIRQLGPASKWEHILEVLGKEFFRLPDISGLEIGRQIKGGIQIEGSRKGQKGWYQKTIPLAPDSCLASCTLENQMEVLLSPLEGADASPLRAVDQRISRFGSSVAVPLRFPGYRKGVLLIHSPRDSVLDTQHLKAIRLLSTYLEQII